MLDLKQISNKKDKNIEKKQYKLDQVNPAIASVSHNVCCKCGRVNYPPAVCQVLC